MAQNNTENLVLAGLLRNATVRATSEATGLSESTVYKYLRDTEFKKKYELAKIEMLEQSTASMQSSLQTAIDTIVEIIEDEKASQQIRLNAADMLLRNSLKFTEQTEILRRLAALEAAQDTN